MERQKEAQCLKQFGIISFITVLLAVLIGAGACTQPKVDPLSVPVMEIDKETAKYPPTKAELAVTPRLMLSLMVFKGDTVTKERLDATLGFLDQSFSKYGNFSPVPQTKVEELLNTDENRKFQASNVADAIQLGKSLNASFVAQLQVMIGESQVINNIDHYKSNVNMTIFTADSGQVVFKKDIVYDTQDYEQSDIDLKKMIQQYFPLRGYILETRGGRQFAKISVGRSLGIKLDRQFQIRERDVKEEIVMGVTRRTVSFSPLALATVTVVKVMEDSSWVSIEEKDRIKVKQGQVVFSMPETRHLF